MKLNEIFDNSGSRKEKFRLGRGIASGKGKTAGRGHKGQKSRSGVAIKGFEGGQMPFYKRVPKRGFNNIFTIKHAEVNLSKLQEFIDSKKLDIKGEITLEALAKAGVVRSSDKSVRLLGVGKLKSKINITVNGVSKTALKAVETCGGKVTVLVSKKQERKALKPKKGRLAKLAEKSAK